MYPRNRALGGPKVPKLFVLSFRKTIDFKNVNRKTKRENRKGAK